MGTTTKALPRYGDAGGTLSQASTPRTMAQKALRTSAIIAGAGILGAATVMIFGSGDTVFKRAIRGFGTMSTMVVTGKILLMETKRDKEDSNANDRLF